MRVLRVHGPDDIRLDELPSPACGDDDVVIRVEACGICGTDLSYVQRGHLRSDGTPLPIGHEASGTIVATGRAVSGFAIGDRVVVNPSLRRDYIIGNGAGEGGFSDLLLVRGPVTAAQLPRLPETVSCELAALAEPLSVALHSVNQGALRLGDRAVVLGVGPIGLGAVHWLSHRGFTDIVAVDLSDARLERAAAFGAHHVINPASTNLREALVAAHGEGPALAGLDSVGTDVFFDMAGAPALLSQVIACGKAHSRIVLTAMYKAPVPLDLTTLLRREISIVPSVGYPTEFNEVVEALAGMTHSLSGYISDRYDLSDVDAAFSTARSPASAKVMVYP